MDLSSLAALVVVVVAVGLVVRGWDVRLVLLGAALLLAGMTGLLGGGEAFAPLATVVR